ncbi:MAG: hypothetical protein F4Y03_07265 [Alphaproteobacteria bacterium]|nr:hypothetical protein [Alphaproteobacteria bacterium]
MADERSGTAEQLTTDERLDRVEEAMVHFNRRQNEDLALSQEMRLDFLQEFKTVKRMLYIVTALLFAAIVTMSIV